jgi:hypothetical protein
MFTPMLPCRPVLLLALAAAAAAAAADPPPGPTRAAYVGIAPGQVAVFDVIGEHGMEHEAERRDLAGTLMAVGYETDGARGVVTIFHPRKIEKILGGCPITFMKCDSQGNVFRDSEYHAPLASTYMVDALFPIGLVPTAAGKVDILQNVYTLDMQMPANLIVETAPNRNDAGWLRTETLARPSEPRLLPPGSSRLMKWEAKYDVDPRGTIALADNQYRLEVSDLGNAIILVNIRLARSSQRSLTPAEAARLPSDIKILQSVARDWILDRTRALKSLDVLIANPKDCVFAPELPFIRQMLESDIKRIGERDPWRYPQGSRATPPPTTQPAGGNP